MGEPGRILGSSEMKCAVSSFCTCVSICQHVLLASDAVQQNQTQSRGAWERPALTYHLQEGSFYAMQFDNCSTTAAS